MRRSNQRALAIVAVAGLAGAAWGQATTFSEYGRVVSRSDLFIFEHVVELSEGEFGLAQLLPEGNVETEATFSGEEVFSLEGFCVSRGDCLIGVESNSVPSGYETVDQQGHAAFESALAEVSGQCVVGYYGGIRAEAEVEALVGLHFGGDGYGEIRQYVGRGAGDMCWEEERFSGACCFSGKTVDDEYGFADISGEYEYEVDSPSMDPVTATVTHTITYDPEERISPRNTVAVCERTHPCDADASYQDFVFCMAITTRFHTASGIVEEVMEGAVIIRNDGFSILPLGFMDDPGFNPFTGFTIFDIEVEHEGVIGQVDVDKMIKSGPVSQFVNGDVDDDGDICGSDRVAFMDALGSSFGDANYTIRADFDLDGDVDSDDLAHLNSIGCTADLDCDGSLTIFDHTAFTNAFDAMEPVADWDGDGMFTTFDYLAYNNTYDLGCS